MGPQDEESLNWFNEILDTLHYGQDYGIVEAKYKQFPKGIQVEREYVQLYTTGIEKLHKIFTSPRHKLLAQMQIECIDPAIDEEFGTIDYDKVAELTLGFINRNIDK